MTLNYVIPVYGVDEYTHAVIAQLLADDVPPQNIIVIDNLGTFRTSESIRIVSPRFNLGWLIATNLGMQLAFHDQSCSAVVWLNNDVEISSGFDDAMRSAADRTAAWMVGPLYDGANEAQRSASAPDLATFRPATVDREVVWLEGTCVLVTRHCFERVGLLDARRFGSRGWGADIDYALRSRSLGGRVVVTEGAFLHHEVAKTASTIDATSFNTRARREMSLALRRQLGADWAQDLGVNERRPVTLLGRLRVRFEEYAGVPHRRALVHKRLDESRRLQDSFARPI